MKKKAVIWVSTVLYILITIAVLGIAFAALKPRIDEMRDKAIIEQSIEMMNDIDETIQQVKEVKGTRRQVQVQLKKGVLIFDCNPNKIVWEFSSTYMYSEPNENIPLGNLVVKTKKAVGYYNVSLTLEYEDIDLRFDLTNEKERFYASELPYTFFFENQGEFIDVTSSG